MNKSKISSINNLNKKSIDKSIAYNPIKEYYNNYEKEEKEEDINRIIGKKLSNEDNNIMNLKNKIKLLENKTSRLQSMNEIFLDLLKNQQKINKNNIKKNPDYIKQFENSYNNINMGPIFQDENNRPSMRKSNSQLNMFSAKDIKYYKGPIKLMQEQLKAYIFQTTLDRRRQEYLFNEKINDIKNEINDRLLKLEHRQQLQFSSIMNSINTGSYGDFKSISQKLMFQQKDKENLEEYIKGKLEDLNKINNQYSKNFNYNMLKFNNMYFNNDFDYINNKIINNEYNYDNNYFDK